MQIHELNNYIGSLGNRSFIVVDDGNDTGKLSTEQLLFSVNAKIDAVDEDLNNRIDNIIAGGDAPSAAEIIDARLGVAELGIINYPSLGSAIRGQATELKNDLDYFRDGFGNYNLWYQAELLYADKYADIVDGHIRYNTNAYGIGCWLLPVEEDATYTTYPNMRMVVPLEADQYTATAPSVISNVGSIDLSNYPDTKWLVISLEGITSVKISKGNTVKEGIIYPTWYLEKTQELLRGKVPSVVERYASIPANTIKSLPIRTNLRKGSRLQFTTEIASYGGIEIGFSTLANGGGTKYNRFEIGVNAGTAYTHYDYTQSAMVSEVFTTSLGISAGVISIIIEELSDAKCKLTIMNNGNTYVKTFDNWVRNYILCPYIVAPYSAFGKSSFSWTCTDLEKAIWMFGDSYMAYEPERWAYYLKEYGYDKNVLIASFPGAWSATAVASIEALLNYGTPKYAIWEMGMNDGSDSGGSPAQAWITNRDLFLAICAENNITPIFGTIPTVSTVNNEEKNAWIRSSGYRYIDFAEAVLANSSGVWGDGMLSGDGVHPTVNGAKALFSRALIDFPELMVDEL